MATTPMIPQLDKVLSSAPLGILQLDANGTIVWANETLAGYTGRGIDELVGHSAEDIDEELRRLFETPDTIFLPDGEGGPGYWLMRNRQALHDNSGYLYYYMNVSLLQDLALEREELREQLRELMAIDEVTGLPNRRALFQKLEPEVSRSRRYNNPLCIILMHLRNRAELAAEYGEAAVNRMLLSIAQMLNDQMRWADSIGRLDEDHILMILPETAIEVTDQLVGKIESRLKNLDRSLEQGGELPPMKVAFGSAQWRKGDDVALLMERARESLAARSNAA